LPFCSVNDHKVNRFFLLFLFLTLASLSASAQYSVQLKYHTGFQKNESISNPNMVLDGSVHYWTRLKRYRLEFLPGIIFQSLNTDQESFQNLGVTVPVSIYAFDFINDCDCPTFSKNAFWFQKGFFIRLTPTWSKNMNQPDLESYDQLFGAGIMLGLDFGISDLLTITPLIGYDQIHSLSGEPAHSDFLHIGVSFLFRHDYRRRYR